MGKKFEAAVYWQKIAGAPGKIKKRGSKQVCEQYIRERKAKSKVTDDGFPAWDLIDDKNDPRLAARGIDVQNDLKVLGKKEIPKEEFWRLKAGPGVVDDGEPASVTPDLDESINIDDQSLKDILNDEPAKEEGE